MSQASASFRRILFQVHLWMGLILCIPLVLLGLTGVALMWPDVVNPLTNPAPRVEAAASAGLPAQAYLDAAQAAAPGSRLQGLRLPSEPGQAVAVTVNNGRAGPGGGDTVWLNPASAAPIKVAPSTSTIFAVSHDLHGSFMAGGIGRQLVGWAGVVMLAISLTGLWLWWPRRGGIGRAFAWRRTPDTFMNLHHLVGFWIAIPLAVVSATGVFISFPSLTASLFGGAPAGPPPAEARAEAPRPPQGGAPGAPRMTASEAVAVAVAGHPGARLQALTLPGAVRRGPAAAGPPTWTVELSDGGAARSVRVDNATGEVLAAPSGPREGPGRASPTRIMRELHEGEGNVVWRWLVTLTGLLPLILAGSGVYYWSKLELRKARARREAAAPAE